MEIAAQKQSVKTGTGPLVSIIVPTFNRGPFLERCLRSILDQSYKNIECIVMDGGSKDDTVSILKRLSAADPRLKYISEPDQGEVYATNKGFDIATGDIMGVQASDDYYVPDAVQKAAEFLFAHPKYIGVSGDAMYVDQDGNSLNRGVVTYRGEMSKNTIRHILMVRYKSCLVCHGAFFGWRKRILAHGKLDPSFSVTPDWEFYLRLLGAGEQIGFLPRVQYHYSVHTDMGAIKHSKRAEAERALLHQKYGLKRRHELFRSTMGRWLSYTANPYRSRFLPGLKREILSLFGRH